MSLKCQYAPQIGAHSIAGRTMKHSHHEDDFDGELDDLSPVVASHIEHLSRKWADEEARHGKLVRRGLTRRRIEDWREERELRRAFEDFDLD